MPRLILVGAGHSHLLLTKRLGDLRSAGLEPMLIAPRWFHYSGLATGVLSGALPGDAERIDIAALATRRDLDFIDGWATEVDAPNRSVRLSDGSSHRYDLLSLNIGSGIADGFAGENVWYAKPLSELTRLRHALETRSAGSIAVVGAGPTGTEVAAALAGLRERLGVRPRISLIGGVERGWGWSSLYRSLEARGVSLIDGKVVERTGGSVRLEDGRALDCDHVVVATGLKANSLAGITPLDPNGGIAVAATLQSVGDPAIFACGDCADFLPRKLPKHGVFGVRQAPVLAENLIAAARGERLAEYRAQRRWLSIMDLGNEEGFVTWGALAWRGRAALALKRRLDLGFVRRFQTPDSSS